MLKIVEKSKLWFSISFIIIAVGMGFIFTRGLNVGMDFKGGTKVVIELGENFNKEEVDAIVEKYAQGAVTNPVGNTQYEIKSKDLSTDKIKEMFAELKTTYNLEANEPVSIDSLGASMGKELTKNSLIALFVSCLAMLVYVMVRFETNYAIAAVVALLHDALITLSVFAIFNIPVNTPFVAAILTIIGYSINDTIVIFDRMRENSKNMRRATPEVIANTSLTQTMSRSICTTLTTLIVIVSVNIFVPTVREFSFPLIIGIAFGAYSSIFLAAPIWVILKKKRKNNKEVKVA